jgi:hypothetical protein
MRRGQGRGWVVEDDEFRVAEALLKMTAGAAAILIGSAALLLVWAFR